MGRLCNMFPLLGLCSCLLILFESSCRPQTNTNINMTPENPVLKTREPYVAGQFYPGDSGELSQVVNQYFREGTVKKPVGKILAVIAPHAGYVFSGSVAAESYKQLDRNQVYDNIFLIGSSHMVSFDGASIYTQGNFKTPLGIVPVNLELAKKLVDQFGCFNNRTDAQLHEHSLEVQLPFLLTWLNHPFRIVPIILGTQRVSTCQQIAEALRPYFNASNLFVISTDFSHYPDYQDARQVDKRTEESILTNQPEMLIRALENNERANVPGLVTSLCGWTSVLTLMDITTGRKDIQYVFNEYRNSGDAPRFGDKSRVVGYCSISVCQVGAAQDTIHDSFSLSKEDKQNLLQIARETLQNYIVKGSVPRVNKDRLSPALLTPAGAFVSLYKKGNLRGCIGQFKPDKPLYAIVQDMAVASSTHDYRFSPVEKEELPDIRIEISVLTPLKRIAGVQDIVLGRDGIYIKKGSRSGTFLPQVAKTTGWSLDDFLGHCARDKAGIGWDGWKDAELYTYQAIVFGE
jgi:AmmeMemoRadiSam system protein B/AmmeMemoRadiSam system protein A